MASVSQETPVQARSIIKQHLDTVDKTPLARLHSQYKDEIPTLQQIVDTAKSHGQLISQRNAEINSHNESIRQKLQEGKQESAKQELILRRQKDKHVAAIKQQAGNLLKQGKALVKTHVLNDLASNHASPVVRSEATKLKSGLGKQKAGRKSRKHRKYKKRKGTVSNKVKYGVKKNKVVKLYGHRITKRIGRHHYYTLWKTTRKNLPGKTYHGKFFNSKKAAKNHTMRRKGKRKSKVRRKTKRRR